MSSYLLDFLQYFQSFIVIDELFLLAKVIQCRYFQPKKKKKTVAKRKKNSDDSDDEFEPEEVINLIKSESNAN